MTLSELAAIGEFVSGIAVLITLVYLTIQIRNNAKEVRTERMRNEIESYTVEQRSYVDGHDKAEIWRQGLVNFGALDPKGKFLFHQVMTGQLLHVQNFYQQHQEGLISEANLTPWMDMMAQLISSPGGTEWWKEVAPVFTPAIVSALNEHLREFDKPSFVDQYPFFDDIKPALRE